MYVRIIAQISVIITWKIKHEGFWGFLDAGNWKSQNTFAIYKEPIENLSTCIGKVRIPLSI